GGPVRDPGFSAREGSIAGSRFDSSGVKFDPSDNFEQRKKGKLQAKVGHDHGGATGDAPLGVKKKTGITATRLPDIIFPDSSPRVNNCGKRVLLEELKALTDKDPGGRVVFVGHVTEKEKNPGNLDRQRAMNAAAVISAGEGICGRFPTS